MRRGRECGARATSTVSPKLPHFSHPAQSHKNETKHKPAATEKQMTNFGLPVNRAVSTPRQVVVGQAVRGHTHRNCRPTTV